jgi:nucleotide-binding universal stress UspA family protein
MAAPIRRILVALDRSPRSADVLSSAVHLARRLDATLVPVSAIHFDLPDRTARKLDEQELLVEAKSALRAMLADETRVSIAPPFVRRGSPWRVILDAAKAFEVDVIAIGGGDDVLGSTAAHVVGRADRSVLVVSHPMRSAENGRFLVGLDTSDHAVTVCETAASIANRIGAGIHPLRAIELPPLVESDDSDLRLVSMITTELLDIAERCAVATVRAPIVRVGPAWSVILAAADEIEADLVALGGCSKERSDMIGRNALRVVHLARRNVLIVRDAPSKTSMPPKSSGAPPRA